MVTTEPSTQTPDRDDGRAAAGRRPARTRRPVALLFATLFFFGPLGAFALGVRPAAFENHALADLPSPGDGWSFFPDFTTWAVDHLPLRQQAVEAYAAGSEKVFGEPPSYGGNDQGPLGGTPTGEDPADGEQTQYAQVIEGDDGWLYFGADMSNMCDPLRSVDDTLQRLDRLAAAVEASGRRFVLAVAPDKTTVFPENLPDVYVGQDCAAERRAAFWDALRSESPDWYVDLRGPLEAEQDRSGPIYRPTDTHWAPHGAAVYARELAGRVDPRLLDDFEVVEHGTTTRPGDLGRMLGSTSDDEITDVRIERPGVTPVGRDSLELPEMPLDGPVTVRDTTTGAYLFPEPTLLLGDSFSNSSRGVLGGLFADLTLLHNEVAATYPQITADAMADADVVVYEIVERTIGSGRGAMIDDATLAAVEATLAANPR